MARLDAELVVRGIAIREKTEKMKSRGVILYVRNDELPGLGCKDLAGLN